MAPKINKPFGENVEATLQIIYFPLSLSKTQNQKIQTNMPTFNINNTITSYHTLIQQLQGEGKSLEFNIQQSK